MRPHEYGTPHRKKKCLLTEVTAVAMGQFLSLVVGSWQCGCVYVNKAFKLEKDSLIYKLIPVLI